MIVINTVVVIVILYLTWLAFKELTICLNRYPLNKEGTAYIKPIIGLLVAAFSVGYTFPALLINIIT